MSGDEAVCLCPLGFTGDLCQTRVDLQVRLFFNFSCKQILFRRGGKGDKFDSFQDFLKLPREMYC